MSLGACPLDALVAAAAAARSMTYVSRRTTPTNGRVPCRSNVPTLKGVTSCAVIKVPAAMQAASAPRTSRFIVTSVTLNSTPVCGCILEPKSTIPLLHLPDLEEAMRRTSLTALIALACVLETAPTWAQAQPAAQRPPIATTKVDGTNNVYTFRNGNHLSMFIVTSEGVIAADPVAYGRPQGGAAYIEEIKKVTDKPIKYLI